MTAPDAMADRLAILEADNARLRRLLDEGGAPDGLRHAFRDTVAVMRTILRRSVETAEDVEDYAAHLVGRLDALVRMRARLDAFGEADLHALVADELLFHLVREGERAVIEGPPVRLRPKAAQMLALAAHELASNGVEHGPFMRPEGNVQVAWGIEPEPAGPVLVLTWKERGGERVTGLSRRGFGTAVLEEMLAYELKARTSLEFEPDGLRYTAHIPLTAQVGRQAEEA